jgi:hypothetical protein
MHLAGARWFSFWSGLILLRLIPFVKNIMLIQTSYVKKFPDRATVADRGMGRITQVMLT